MHIQWQFGYLFDRLDDRRPDRDVGHKMTIHHIDMKDVAPASSTLRMSSPSAAKFADKIDGAIRMLTG